MFHFQVLFFDPVGNDNRGVKIKKKKKKRLTPPPSIFLKKRLKNIVFNFLKYVAFNISNRAFSIGFITLLFIYSKIFNTISIDLMSSPPLNIKKTKNRGNRKYKSHHYCQMQSLCCFHDVKK